MNTTKLLLLGVLVLGCSAFKSGHKNSHKVKATHYSSVKVPEPSDITVDPGNGHLYIVSDNGLLYECDEKGKVLRKAKQTGWDFEGVEVLGDTIYVADESARKVYLYDKQTLQLGGIYSVPYNGARNSGYESLAYNHSKKVFVLITEKDPVTIFELDHSFRFLKEYPFKAARDIASARWHNGFMYLLSDEDQCVLRCDPNTYQVLEKYKLDILNPEGIAFDKNGNVIICADDLQRLYFLNSFSTGNE